MKKLLIIFLALCMPVAAYAQQSEVGRYQLVSSEDGYRVFRIDTATGRTWCLEQYVEKKTDTPLKCWYEINTSNLSYSPPAFAADAIKSNE